LYVLFWTRVFPNDSVFGQISIRAYYLLFIIAGGFLLVHVESDSNEDIRHGGLSAFLLKPFSYFWLKFYSELPWRLIQGFFGLLSLFFLVYIFNISFPVYADFPGIIFALSIWIFGYFLMFYFKMLILLSALWITDTGGLKQFSEIIVLIFCGFIIPIPLFPGWLKTVALLSPFPYMMYYPVVSLAQGFGVLEWIRISAAQLLWLVLFMGLYAHFWKKGIRLYTALGQ
jgi:ABC-2 type transport system permease protein